MGSILPACPIESKVHVVRLFHYIINAGQPPHEGSPSEDFLRSTPRQTIVDIPYIMERLARSGALAIISEQFLLAVKELDYNAESDNPSRVLKSEESPVRPNPLDEDLTLYGLPPRNPPDATTQVSSLAAELELSLESSPPKEKKAILWELTQAFLDLCLDITVHEECAIGMCENSVCNAAIYLLKKDFDHDKRDPRLSYVVELMWNVLEPFIGKMRSFHGSPDHDEIVLFIKHGGIMDLEHCMKVLVEILDFQIMDGYRQSDKEFRNMILIVLSLFAELPNVIGYFTQSQLLTWLVTYACVEEIGHKNWLFFTKKVANKRNYATTADIDLEFKKQLWMLLTQLLKNNDPDALLCIAASPLMPCMMMYLEKDSPDNSIAATSTKRNLPGTLATGASQLESHFSPHPSLSYGGEEGFVSRSMVDDRRGGGGGGGSLTKGPLKAGGSMLQPSHSSSQNVYRGGVGIVVPEKTFIGSLTPSKLREFQVQAILFLLQNAPKMLGEFERIDGIARILATILKYSQSDNADHKMLVFYGLVLLHRSLLNSQSVRRYLEENQGLIAFLQIFSLCSDEESRAQAVRIVASLCSGCQPPQRCAKQFRECQGLRLLLEPLRAYVQRRPPIVGLKAAINIYHDTDKRDPLPDPLDNAVGGEISVLVIAIIDAISQGVVRYPANEQQFADLEGIDALFDLLEIAPFVLRLHILRVLTDLLINPKLVIFANCWRSSKTLRSAAQLLCHAWLDEETRLEAERPAEGIINNLFDPLGQHHWPVSEAEQPLLGFHNDGYHNTFTQSVTVSKLASAILAGRSAVQTNLPIQIANNALESDSRSVLSEIMGHLGLYDTYQIQDETSPFKTRDSMGEFLMAGNSTTMGGDGNELLSMSKRTPGAPSVEMLQSRKSQHQNLSISRGNFGGSAEGGNETGFDEVKLHSREKQVLVIAKKYLALREGDWWRQVKESFEEKKLVPIEADAALIQERLDHAFDAAVATQTEQMLLFDEHEADRKQEENGFLGQILTKKHQQIKAEWIKRNAKGAPKKTTKPKTLVVKSE